MLAAVRLKTNRMIPHIILIMQTKDFEPIAFVEDLCVCNEDGNISIFPDFESAVKYREEHTIDGKIVGLPVYS